MADLLGYGIAGLIGEGLKGFADSYGAEKDRQRKQAQEDMAAAMQRRAMKFQEFEGGANYDENTQTYSSAPGFMSKPQKATLDQLEKQKKDKIDEYNINFPTEELKVGSVEAKRARAEIAAINKQMSQLRTSSPGLSQPSDTAPTGQSMVAKPAVARPVRPASVPAQGLIKPQAAVAQPDITRQPAQGLLSSLLTPEENSTYQASRQASAPQAAATGVPQSLPSQQATQPIAAAQPAAPAQQQAPQPKPDLLPGGYHRVAGYQSKDEEKKSQHLNEMTLKYGDQAGNNLRHYKRYNDALSAVDHADAALKTLDLAQVNPIAFQSKALETAKAIVENGRINQQEIQMLGGSKAFKDQFDQFVQSAEKGTITPANYNFYKQLIGVTGDSAKKRLQSSIDDVVMPFATNHKIPYSTAHQIVTGHSHNKPLTIEQGGHTYNLNEDTGKYE